MLFINFSLPPFSISSLTVLASYSHMTSRINKNVCMYVQVASGLFFEATFQPCTHLQNYNFK